MRNFFAGDVIKICNDEFFATHGRPDVIITDPQGPVRKTGAEAALEIRSAPHRLCEKQYGHPGPRPGLVGRKNTVLKKIQPVDMFPHTHHIECVLLERNED